MYGFLISLDTQTVFHHYQGVPPDPIFQEMQRRATSNVELARQYLGVKLLTVGFLEALAEATGGDAPVSLFIGDNQRMNGNGQHLEDFLPELVSPLAVDTSSQVCRLLETGRSSQVYFDQENSPVSLYLYRMLGQQGVQQNLAIATDLFSGRLTPEEFLTRADAGIVSDLARACAAMVATRSEKMNRYVKQKKEMP
jgi:hypothetical protein